MKVLFTHSYFLEKDPKQRRTARPYPPLATLYALAAVRAAGHEAALLDVTFASGASALDAALDRHAPDVLVIYDDGFNWLTKMCLEVMEREALAMVRAARGRGLPVLVHSSDATDHRQKYLEAGASYVLLGEGEPTLVELLPALAAGAPARSIPGLAWMRDGRREETGPRRGANALDALPRAAWEDVDFAPYEALWRRRWGRFSLNLVSSRGCPYGCNWCAKPLFGRQYFVHSPGRMVDDLRWLKKRCGLDHVWFADDIFGLTADWCEGFADALEAAALKVPFAIQTRADLILQDRLRRGLVRAGLETAWLGAESGSQAILDAMDKGLTVEQTRQAVRALQKDGVRVGLFLQYGYLGETDDDIRKTLAMLEELMPDEIGVSVSYPLPGTPFHEKVKERMSGKTNWTHSDDLDLMFPGSHEPAFYRRLHRYTHHFFQARRGQASLRRLLSSPLRAPAPEWRAAAATLYHAPAAALAQRRLWPAAR